MTANDVEKYMQNVESPDGVVERHMVLKMRQFRKDTYPDGTSDKRPDDWKRVEAGQRMHNLAYNTILAAVGTDTISRNGVYILNLWTVIGQTYDNTDWNAMIDVTSIAQDWQRRVDACREAA